MISNVNLTELKPTIQQWAKQFPNIHAIILFGSRALNKHRPDSDYDICVMVDPNQSEDWYTIWFFNADIWKKEFSVLIGVPEELIQFCSLTSEEVKNGIENGCKFLFLREDLPQILPDK